MCASVWRLFALVLLGLWLAGCDRCTSPPPEATGPDGDREADAEPEIPPPSISTEPTPTDNWGRIALPEMKASLGFPSELAVMDNTLRTEEGVTHREILMARPKNDGRLDLFRFSIREIPRDPETSLDDLLARTRQVLADRDTLTLDLQQQDPWEAGGDGAWEIRQLFHYLSGTNVHRIRRVVWALPNRAIILNFEAKDPHYRALGVYVNRMAEHFRLDPAATSPKR